MADFVQVDAAGIAIIYEDEPKVQVDAAGICVVWSEQPTARVKVNAAGLAVVWSEVPPGEEMIVPVSCQDIGIESLAAIAFWEYARKFPVFDDHQQFETQPGKMKFPWLT